MLPLPAHAQAAAAKLWSTYVGGSGVEDISGIAQNATTGDVVAVGSTTSKDIPPCTGTGTLSFKDALVSIFSSTGTATSPCITFGGAAADDAANAVAVGPSGDIYVVGTTRSSSIPLFGTNITGTYSGGGDDAFLARFTSTGAPVWFMYLGSAGSDAALGVAVLGTDVYVTGSTDSATFMGGTGPALAGTAGFVVKVNASAALSLSWVKLIDGAGSDVLNAIALAQPTGLLAVGTTSSGSLAFPTLSGPKGAKDALVVKLSEAGDVAWVTYLGTPQDDEGRAVFSGATMDIIVAGTMPGNLVGKQAFVTWLNSSGTERETQLFGGIGDDEVLSAALDLNGNVYVGGKTSSTDFPKDRAFDPDIEGGSVSREGFVAMLPATGGPPGWASFVGATGVDMVKALSIRSGRRLVLGGTTFSNDLVTTSPYDATPGTPPDGFVMALDALDISAPIPRTVNDRPQEDGLLEDVDEQFSTASISANWAAFIDNESGVARYECAVGTTPGGTEVSGFVLNNPFGKTSCTIQAALTVGTTYYVTVRGTNGVKLIATSTSDGVTVKAPPSTDGGSDGGTDGGTSGSDGGTDGGTDETPSTDDAALLGWSCTAAGAGLPMLIGLAALSLLMRRRRASSR
jgi:hypothetical protein